MRHYSGDDKTEGPVPLPRGWSDAWEAVGPRGDPGYTYDAKVGRRRLQARPRLESTVLSKFD